MKLYCRANEMPLDAKTVLEGKLRRLGIPYQRFDDGIIVDCEGDYSQCYMQVVLAFEQTGCDRVIFYQNGGNIYGKRQTAAPPQENQECSGSAEL